MSRIPESWKAHFLLGLVRLHKGQTEAAQRAFAASRGYGQWEAATYQHLGDAYRRRNDLDHAASAYGEAVRLAPDEPLARFLLGFTDFLRGREAAALDAARGAVALDDGLGDAWMLIGIAESTAGRPEAAFRSALDAQRVERLQEGGVARISRRFAALPGSAGALELYAEIARPD